MKFGMYNKYATLHEKTAERIFRIPEAHHGHGKPHTAQTNIPVGSWLGAWLHFIQQRLRTIPVRVMHQLKQTEAA